jgi:thiamine-phosphate pyrophosphorylase
MQRTCGASLIRDLLLQHRRSQWVPVLQRIVSRCAAPGTRENFSVDAPVSKNTPPISRPLPRLYLATPEVEDPSSLVSSLPGLLAGADIAAVLLRLKMADQRSMISRVKTLAPAIQNAGAALLLDGHVELVARAGADGAHLNGLAALEEALPSLKPDRIAGVGGLATRHDSMAAGERGADYVLFGEPDTNGKRPSMDAVAERLDWWAELFEPPCIAWAASRDEAYAFVLAGADFILVADAVWADPRGASAALAEIGQAMRQAHAAARGAAKARQA